MEKTAIYYKTAEAARDAGELEIYRTSMQENRRTARIIDAAIAAHFDGCTLPAAALADVLQQADPERVALVLAATLDSKPYDGRFSLDNRTWAASVRRPDNFPEALAAGNVWYTCTAHSAVLNGFITQFRRQQAETMTA